MIEVVVAETSRNGPVAAWANSVTVAAATILPSTLSGAGREDMNSWVRLDVAVSSLPPREGNPASTASAVGVSGPDAAAVDPYYGVYDRCLSAYWVNINGLLSGVAAATLADTSAYIYAYYALAAVYGDCIAAEDM